MDSFFDEKKEELKKMQEVYEADVVNSQAYQQSFNYMKSLLDDFQKGLIIIAMSSSRNHSAYMDSALMFSITELVGSITSIRIISNELVMNASKRELRYMLEATIKYSAVDQFCKGQSLEEKLEFFYEKIPRSSISPLDEIHGLDDLMVTDTKELYSLLSQFTHPSKRQITEYKMQLDNKKIGFQDHKDLDTFNKLLFRTFDTIMYLCLRNQGPYVMKDFFYVLNEKKWKFHKGKHLGKLPNKYRKK
ncbi:hypothetical protein ACI2JA_10885 [Alkalihalobacillus sp. NPDC078783]